jgi:hypothetical protein
MSKRPHLYGADLRCPTCGKPAYDMVAGHDLFDDSLGIMADNADTRSAVRIKVYWKCTQSHMNLTTLIVGEVTTKTMDKYGRG